jgi:hypothetical protein
MTTIDNNNYELWLLRYAEDELTAVERETVEAWLADHPEAAEELALYSEAPRLERDETVRYAAVPQQSTEPLWPALLRWSAAAAVVVALMVPALRMGTMGHLEPQEPLVIAAAQPPQETRNSRATRTPRAIRESRETRATSPAALLEDTLPSIASVDSIPVIPAIDSVPAVDTTPSFVPSTSIIVYTPAPDTIYTNTLIVYDDSRPRLSDLAADWVEDTPVAKFIRHNFSPRKAVLIASR